MTPSREELPDLEHLTDLLDGAWPSGHKAMAASIIAAGYSRAGSAQYFDMLWQWFEERRGAEDMRATATDGLSADDFKQMLDNHEAELLPDAALPRLRQEVRACDCGANDSGRWRDVHSSGCAALRGTAGPSQDGGRQDARGGVGNAEKAPELAPPISTLKSSPFVAVQPVGEPKK